jgi:NTE family protein
MSSIATVKPIRPRDSLRSMARRPRPRTAFVLSGGASLGALQVGMLRALYEQGVAADLLVGTSVGALNAAFVASRPQTPATADELARVWRGLQREDIFPVSLRALVGGLCGQRDHLVPDLALRRLVRRYIQFEQLTEATVPLHVVAFDVIEHCEVLLSDGPALDAIAAAAALPGVFPPVPIGERRLIDGGVVNNTPISHAVELGAQRVYVLPTQGPGRPSGRTPRSALDTAIHALGVLLDGRLDADLARYSSEAELIVLPASNPEHVQPTDFDHSSRLIGQACDACRTLFARGDVLPARRDPQTGDVTRRPGTHRAEVRSQVRRSA